MAIQSWTTSLLVYAEDTTRPPDRHGISRVVRTGSLFRPVDRGLRDSDLLSMGAFDDRPLALRLLAAGVPLSLLVDLVFGPDSEAIALSERAGWRSPPPYPGDGCRGGGRTPIG
jgi:hypothetical protein